MIKNDYLDDFVHGYVVHQRIEDLHREAEQHRMIKKYRAAHPERRPAAKVARLLRRAADRLAPEPVQSVDVRPAAPRLKSC